MLSIYIVPYIIQGVHISFNHTSVLNEIFSHSQSSFIAYKSAYRKNRSTPALVDGILLSFKNKSNSFGISPLFLSQKLFDDLEHFSIFSINKENLTISSSIFV